MWRVAHRIGTFLLHIKEGRNRAMIDFLFELLIESPYEGFIELLRKFAHSSKEGKDKAVDSGDRVSGSDPDKNNVPACTLQS